ncbi:MAG: hypothetical protein P8M80_10055 [Pirellulaceae bacterium]|jgi:hypothetical protein|nr:hypothetical protein [Pirellulaceae bacterium]
MLTRLKALQMLHKCRGDEIWPRDICESEGVPTEWVDELADCTESGFKSDQETLYNDQGMVNHFYGVQDLRLAYRLGEFLGAHTKDIPILALSRTDQVRLIKESVEEL